MIGIKIANGEFYPILGEDETSAKRLVLTTVKDDQETVHIDLYRSEGQDFSNPSFLGSLVIDGIAGRPKQVPDIELTLAVDEAGELKARAADRESGTSRSLTVALTQGSEEPEFTIPDFELDTEPEIEEPVEAPHRVPASSLTLLRDDDEEEQAEELKMDEPAPTAKASRAAEFTQATQTFEEPERKRGLSPLAIALIIVVGLAILVLLGFLLFKCVPLGKPKASASPVAVASIQPSPTEEPSPSPLPSPSPTATPDELGKNGSKGLWIKIKWGDTLWDLATRYYGNPWLYKKIAKANKIRNPDLIISGHKLWIPPR
jgi:nucleoid-associated protein YgaU